VFDNITIAEVVDIYEFFPDREDYISSKEDGYVTYMVDEQRKCGDLYTGYLQSIINTWEMEERALRREFQELNRSLLTAFCELEDKVVYKDNLADFLDWLCFGDDGKYVYVSSHYSDYRQYGGSWDEFYELVVGYIVKLVQREEIIFEDFTFSDEFFWNTLKQKEWRNKPDVK
jgi:hypothetical protein